MKQTAGNVPTIQVDLASPESPDSMNLTDELKKGEGQQNEDHGLVMRPPSGTSRSNKPEESDRDHQKLTRCLSDPGPSADEEEEEPFLI